MQRKKEVDQIKAALNKRTPATKPPKPEDLLSTGSTCLNLACSGSARGGLAKGHYYFFVGDSSSGKTWWILTILAEAARNKNFDGYSLVFDNVERGALMNIEKYFGKRLAQRLEAPEYDAEGNPLHSEEIEDFYMKVRARLAKGPCIYVVDSMDALSSKYETKKTEAADAARRKGPAALAKLKGDYGDGKAAVNSRNIRQIDLRLAKNGSILIIISQTRDNIDEFSFEKKTRAGGRALKFYAGLEVWTSVKKHLTKSVKGKDRQIGITVKAHIKKNRLTGKEWTVEVPLYHSYGIDDVGGCVNWLCDEGVWHRNESGVITGALKDVEYKGKLDSIVKQIEEAGHHHPLRIAVAEAWEELEEACAIKRKPRYD